MSSNPKHSFIRSLLAITQNVFFCKITNSWKLPSVVCLATAGEWLYILVYHKLSVALNFLFMLLSHALGQHSVVCTKNFLSHAHPSPSSTRSHPEPARTALQAPKPACKCRYLQPAQDFVCMTQGCKEDLEPNASIVHVHKTVDMS